MLGGSVAAEHLEVAWGNQHCVVVGQYSFDTRVVDFVDQPRSEACNYLGAFVGFVEAY